MKIFKPGPAGYDAAAAEIQAGRLVAFATETVYGLGGNAEDDRAVAAIYDAKGRPSFNPLIIHVPTLEIARRYVRFSPLAERLAATFWPGSSLRSHSFLKPSRFRSLPGSTPKSGSTLRFQSPSSPPSPAGAPG